MKNRTTPRTLLRNCDCCGNPYKAFQNFISRGSKKGFCSPRCQSRGMNKSKIMSCIVCGSLRDIPTHRQKSFRFCSMKCSGLAKKGLPFPGKHFSASGEKNPAWKGGVTPLRWGERLTWKYEKWREAVLKRDKRICQLCGQKGGFLCVDHIKPWAQFPELRFSMENGRTLCIPCHRKTPTYGRNEPRELSPTPSVSVKLY